ncbi:hypothetical protein [Epilithonimonas hominis]|uniref:hypothetical protein n=1 Tax=Epilithonimonas hominis TaxID=420404 RepID=UPI000EC3FF7B|nr:hypothetical protein [Epilithonimonas hominis]HAP94525.1 hypothetical protein [Chryseobacterium sp.]
MKKVFIIQYRWFDVQGQLKQTGTSKVKNRVNQFSAMIALEDNLKRKFPKTFGKVEILSCRIDYPATAAMGTFF